MQTPNGNKLYEVAKASLGKDLNGNYNELGCAFTLNNLAQWAWGKPIGGGASTADLFKFLQDTNKFTPVDEANTLPGDIIMSATGTSIKKPTAHGHCGVVAKYGIVSNSSEDDSVQEQWNIKAWNAYYHDYLGFPVYYFRPV